MQASGDAGMGTDPFPPELHSLLGQIGRSAEASVWQVYLVGGTVRDRLLGRPLKDVDLAVDGDAVALASGLAVEARVRTHRAFLTASVELPDGRRLDLATVRSEVYDNVAALPTVRRGSLRDDLERRDFTINSMAAPLSRIDHVIDPTGGRHDLERGLLRVHHERSFLDDPTRILRGVRFESRLGFAMDPGTESLARAAVTAGAIAALSTDRLEGELRRLFGESGDRASRWRRLKQLGVADVIGLASSGAGERIRNLTGALDRWRERYGDRWPVSPADAYLRELLLAQEPSGRAKAAARLGWRASDLDRLEEIARALAVSELAPLEVARRLETLDSTTLLNLAASGEAADHWVHEHLATQRELKLGIDGDMLIGRGYRAGPAIGSALRATREARLEGRIGAAEELSFAVEQLQGRGDR